MRNKCIYALTAAVPCLALTVSLAATPPSKKPTAGQAPLAKITTELKWRMIGPFRGGRTRAVAGVPAQPDRLLHRRRRWRVWKTDDAGRTWQPIFDDQPTQSIGAIAVAPSDPNIVYVGSGEGLHRPDLSVGDGIYRSADAGRTWSHLGLRDGQQIPDLAIDPQDPNRVFAAVLGHPYGPNPERGIYRSLDGGQSWQKVLFKDDDTGGSAVAIDPTRPQIVYAALWQDRLGPWEDRNQFQGTGGGLFKSSDGGNTWRKLSRGLPENTSQVNLTLSRPVSPSGSMRSSEPTSPASIPPRRDSACFAPMMAAKVGPGSPPIPRPSLRIGGGDLPVLRADPSNPDVVYSTGTRDHEVR